MDLLRPMNCSPATVIAGGALQTVAADVKSKHTGQLEIAANADELSRLAAGRFVDLVGEAVRVKDLCSVALSGGSTPTKLYQLLADENEPYRARLRWNKIHFFWGDERLVPPDNAESNYRLASEAMLSKVPVPVANVHRIKTEFPNADLVAAAYEHALREFFRFHNGEFPRFDLILLGVGSDGHTASLFPASDAIVERNRLAVAPWVEELKSYRMTLTLPVINNAAAIMILVSGSEKATVLHKALESDYEKDHLPVQLVKPTNGGVFWLVDREASQLLSTE